MAPVHIAANYKIYECRWKPEYKWRVSFLKFPHQCVCKLQHRQVLVQSLQVLLQCSFLISHTLPLTLLSYFLCSLGKPLFFMQSHTEMVGLVSDLGWRRLNWTQIFGGWSILFLFLLLTPQAYFSPQTWFLSCVFLPVITCVAENWYQRWIKEAGAWQTAVNLSCTHVFQMAPCWTTLSVASILSRFKWHLLSESPKPSFCFTFPSQAHSTSAATAFFSSESSKPLPSEFQAIDYTYSHDIHVYSVNPSSYQGFLLLEKMILKFLWMF